MRGVHLILIAAGSATGAAAESWSKSEDRRHRDLQLSSGLHASQAERDEAKYDPTKGTLPAFPNGTAGTFFAGVFSDHTVLQRGPAKAAVYGVLFGAQPGTTVTVEVAIAAGDVEASGSYSVPATVALTSKQAPGGRYAKWKAFLKPAVAGGSGSHVADTDYLMAPSLPICCPHAAVDAMVDVALRGGLSIFTVPVVATRAGNYTVSVSCAGCTNTTKASIADVTFGCDRLAFGLMLQACARV